MEERVSKDSGSWTCTCIAVVMVKVELGIAVAGLGFAKGGFQFSQCVRKFPNHAHFCAGPRLVSIKDEKLLVLHRA